MSKNLDALDTPALEQSVSAAVEGSIGMVRQPEYDYDFVVEHIDIQTGFQRKWDSPSYSDREVTRVSQMMGAACGEIVSILEESPELMERLRGAALSASENFDREDEEYLKAHGESFYRD